MLQKPINVAVSGAGGQIGYALLFRIASGQLFPNQKVNLRLLEIPQGIQSATGIAMELFDCAFPLLNNIEIYTEAHKAFEDVNVVFLVGAMPRREGMERSDLLSANAKIFAPQGRALNEVAADDVKVLVVGNPANTNALITAMNAPDIPDSHFSAMTRLDHNRAVAFLAEKCGSPSASIDKVTIWGNHSSTQYPDITKATVDGNPIKEILSDKQWVEDVFLSSVANRGGEIIKVRGLSSAASAASAALDQMRDWIFGSDKSWVSACKISEGEYGIEPGLMFSYPIVNNESVMKVVEGLEVDEYSRKMIRRTELELISERNIVKELGLI
ncbi:malate dehydrogenase [Actinomyces sp. zg-332]|uniref:malate dehydrogenase n=1 Tax=Actinomyces sp. zg-332 TaxID=2708340 RepID=UPI001423740B|nr:malate dehydrogenase [Actinomyces sp. zg-332]QPK93817.1 malate dehydrogenase [Actinomyces sp. zg-332]